RSSAHCKMAEGELFMDLSIRKAEGDLLDLYADLPLSPLFPRPAQRGGSTVPEFSPERAPVSKLTPEWASVSPSCPEGVSVPKGIPESLEAHKCPNPPTLQHPVVCQPLRSPSALHL
ncbi:hypothetical protein M9458_048645, partial [Cirrhinus mrigala]